MTSEQQRISIAEACGWVHYDGEQTIAFMWAPGHISNVIPKWMRTTNDVVDFLIELPDYLNDLNAMHEAEKVLTQDQWWLFLTNLRDTFNPLPGDPRDKIFVHATAAQRAEAFLRTIGKWEDDK